VIYLSALIQLLPLIKALISLFVKSPEEKRRDWILGVHSAIKKASDSGDTSQLESLINGL
jgi:hypothetical protein